MGVEEEMLLGQEWAKEAPQSGVLSKSSRFDLELGRKASKEVEASPSGLSTITTLDDTVVLATVEEVGKGLDLGRCTLAVASCSACLSLPTGESLSSC